MSHDSIAKVLGKYIPEAAVTICCSWIVQYNIHVRITKSRASKFGDYRPLRGREGHQITINHDLNPYSFLITFVHEIAHLLAETNSRKRISPHGIEWKNEFSSLLGYFLQLRIFPPDIVVALTAYMRDPAASSCSDHDLLRVLRKYDTRELVDIRHLEDLPAGTMFRLYSSRSGQVFRKGSQLRTRFHCIEINTKREYYVSALAEVLVHEIPEEGIQLRMAGS